MKIAMWSGPRNLSTAMMYAFAARGDCAVWDEPFYAPYLKKTGLDHPMAAEIISAHEDNAEQVSQQISGSIPAKKPYFYMKHMPHHMCAGFSLSWIKECKNVFLIRHPARVVASYAKKRENPTFQDLGYAEQTTLFDEITKQQGARPVVIDSSDIRADPNQMLEKLCAAIGIPYTDKMLSWPKGGHTDDGVWASHWYGAVHQSTGFDQSEGPLPQLSDQYATLAEAALPHYERLARYKIQRV